MLNLGSCCEKTWSKLEEYNLNYIHIASGLTSHFGIIPASSESQAVGVINCIHSISDLKVMKNGVGKLLNISGQKCLVINLLNMGFCMK